MYTAVTKTANSMTSGSNLKPGKSELEFQNRRTRKGLISKTAAGFLHQDQLQHIYHSHVGLCHLPSVRIIIYAAAKARGLLTHFRQGGSGLCQAK